MSSTLPVSKKKIKVIKGDLLDFPDGISGIIHGCNTRNNFGAGIALAIKKKFPEAYAADSRAYTNSTAVLGNFSFAELDDNRSVYNLYQQSTWHKKGGHDIPLSYDALLCGLKKVRDYHFQKFVTPGKLGIPWCMGCGLAGGNWNIVSEIIRETFAENEVVIVKLDA